MYWGEYQKNATKKETTTQSGKQSPTTKIAMERKPRAHTHTPHSFAHDCRQIFPQRQLFANCSRTHGPARTHKQENGFFTVYACRVFLPPERACPNEPEKLARLQCPTDLARNCSHRRPLTVVWRCAFGFVFGGVYGTEIHCVAPGKG